MKYKSKKILALFLGMLMLCSLFTVSAAAETAEAEGVVLPPGLEIAGTLTIYSSSSGGSSSASVAGHAFILFENTSSRNVKIGALTIAPSGSVTFGTWGNKLGHEGIWYNLEAYDINIKGEMDDRVSLSMGVVKENIDTINTLISENDTWSLFNNCSSFAVKIWNSVSVTDLSAGLPNTPTNLSKSIKKVSGYQTARAVPNATSIGYADNGSFVYTGYPTSSSSEIDSVFERRIDYIDIVSMN